MGSSPSKTNQTINNTGQQQNNVNLQNNKMNDQRTTENSNLNNNSYIEGANSNNDTTTHSTKNKNESSNEGHTSNEVNSLHDEKNTQMNNIREKDNPVNKNVEDTEKTYLSSNYEKLNDLPSKQQDDLNNQSEKQELNFFYSNNNNVEATNNSKNIEEIQINHKNPKIVKIKPTSWDNNNQVHDGFSHINSENDSTKNKQISEKIQNPEINNDKKIEETNDSNHIKKSNVLKSSIDPKIESNSSHVQKEDNDQNKEIIVAPTQNNNNHDKVLTREQNMLLSPIIYHKIREKPDDSKYFDLGPYNNLHVNHSENKETGEIDHGHNEAYDPYHDENIQINAHKSADNSLTKKDINKNSELVVTPNDHNNKKKEKNKTSNLDMIKEQDSNLDSTYQNRLSPKKNEISELKIESNDLPIDEKLATKPRSNTKDVNMDDISLRFEKNVNEILQRHVISQRKFEEMKNEKEAALKLNLELKALSEQLQQELDLYSRTVENFYQNSSNISSLDEEIDKKFVNKVEEKNTIPVYKINAPLSPTKSIKIDEKDLKPEKKAFDLDLTIEDLSSIDKSKIDDKLNNSVALSPFMVTKRNNSSKSSSISLEKSYSFDSQKTNESLTVEVDESIKNWIDTIQALNQNIELKNYCLSRNRNSFTTYDELKDFLKTPLAKTDFEKAWVAFFWICHNIEYDINAFKHRSFDIKPKSVFMQHKTIAAGYSSLFKDLCEHQGLNCYHIKGYAKGFSFEYGKPLNRENHDWNSIQINNKHYLVECTWGAGFVTPEHKFKKKFQPYHFCAPPHVFSEQHFSENCQYQEKKLKFDEFHRLAFKKLEFFLLGLECLNSNLTNIIFRENPIQLSFVATSSIHLVASLKNDKNKKTTDCIFIQKNPEALLFEINVSLPDLNQHSLDIFALNETKKQYSFLCRYYLKTKTLSSNEKTLWCQSYQTKKDFYLYQPLNKLLDARKTHIFKLYADVEDVVLIDSRNNYSHFDRVAFETNVWYTEKYSLLRGNLDICVKYEKNDSYWTCYSYEVF